MNWFLEIWKQALGRTRLTGDDVVAGFVAAVFAVAMISLFVTFVRIAAS